MTWTFLGYAVLVAVACWLLVKLLAAPLFQITYRPDEPDIHIDEEMARADREARRFADFKRPTLSGPSAKGFDRSHLHRVVQIGDSRRAR